MQCWRKVKDSISFQFFMDLCNVKLSSGSDLFPADVLEKAVEKSSKILHDEAIQKVVSCDKFASKRKKLDFSQPSRQQQQPKSSSGSSAGSSFPCSSSEASCSSSRRGKGKKFLRFLAYLAATGGRCSRPELACLAVMLCRRMDGCSSPAKIQDPVPSPPTCVAGTPGTVILCSRVGSCASSSGGSLQNAPKGSFGTHGPAGFRVLQSAVPCGEGDGLVTRHRSVNTEWLLSW